MCGVMIHHHPILKSMRKEVPQGNLDILHPQNTFLVPALPEKVKLSQAGRKLQRNTPKPSRFPWSVATLKCLPSPLLRMNFHPQKIRMNGQIGLTFIFPSHFSISHHLSHFLSGGWAPIFPPRRPWWRRPQPWRAPWDLARLAERHQGVVASATSCQRLSGWPGEMAGVPLFFLTFFQHQIW